MVKPITGAVDPIRALAASLSGGPVAAVVETIDGENVLVLRVTPTAAAADRSALRKRIAYGVSDFCFDHGISPAFAVVILDPISVPLEVREAHNLFALVTAWVTKSSGEWKPTSWESVPVRWADLGWVAYPMGVQCSLRNRVAALAAADLSAQITHWPMPIHFRGPRDTVWEPFFTALCGTTPRSRVDGESFTVETAAVYAPSRATNLALAA